MATVGLQQWHCKGCQRHIVCKADTLSQLGWRLDRRGSTCPECRKKENGTLRSGFDFVFGETGHAKGL